VVRFKLIYNNYKTINILFVKWKLRVKDCRFEIKLHVSIIIIIIITIIIIIMFFLLVG
jgi:hypothetical protein